MLPVSSPTRKHHAQLHSELVSTQEALKSTTAELDRVRQSLQAATADVVSWRTRAVSAELAVASATMRCLVGIGFGAGS